MSGSEEPEGERKGGKQKGGRTGGENNRKKEQRRGKWKNYMNWAGNRRGKNVCWIWIDR